MKSERLFKNGTKKWGNQSTVSYPHIGAGQLAFLKCLNQTRQMMNIQCKISKLNYPLFYFNSVITKQRKCEGVLSAFRKLDWVIRCWSIYCIWALLTTFYGVPVGNWFMCLCAFIGIVYWLYSFFIGVCVYNDGYNNAPLFRSEYLKRKSCTV